MAIRLVVTGRVQGVWFRASARDEAVRIGLKGRVRNLADGSVEIIAVGEQHLLDELIAWAHKGPPQASVIDVSVETLPTEPPFSSFELIY